MSQATLFDDAEVIHTYSRAQAIDDGVLVDLCAGELGALVREAGFKFPVACTAEVFTSCIEVSSKAAKAAGCDVNGRLWDVLHMLKLAIRRAPSGSQQINFSLLVVQDSRRPTRVDLKALVGPGDHGEPVVTIMFPEQD